MPAWRTNVNITKAVINAAIESSIYLLGLKTTFCPPSSINRAFSCVPLYPTSALMIFLVVMACMTAPSSGVSSGYTSRGTTHCAAISQGDCSVCSSRGSSATRSPDSIRWNARWSSRLAADVSRLSMRKTLVKMKMTRRMANSTTRCFSFMVPFSPSPLTLSSKRYRKSVGDQGEEGDVR